MSSFAIALVAVTVSRSYHVFAVVSLHSTQALARLADIVSGDVSRTIVTHDVKSVSNGVAISRDGSELLLTDGHGTSHAIHVYSMADGSRLRVIGSLGDGPLQFRRPHQVWVASDDFVFVADCDNHRVQVLTPSLDFHGFVGVGQLRHPIGVCADADVVVVAEWSANRVSVFSRVDGALLRQFGDGELLAPHGVCFASDHARVVVVDHGNSRVSVFGVDGAFVRHVGVGALVHPTGVACSAHDELVVANFNNSCVRLFSAGGEVVKTIGRGGFSGVAIHSGTIVAVDKTGDTCVLFT